MLHTLTLFSDKHTFTETLKFIDTCICIMELVPSEARSIPGLDRVLYGYFASYLNIILACHSELSSKAGSKDVKQSELLS